MKNKPQIRWAVIGCTGLIRSDTIRFTRKGTIAEIVAEHRKYNSPRYNGTGLTDAQFWRWLKRRRFYSVKRVSLKVVR